MMMCDYKCCVSTSKPLPNTNKQCSSSFGVSWADTPPEEMRAQGGRETRRKDCRGKKRRGRNRKKATRKQKEGRKFQYGIKWTATGGGQKAKALAQQLVQQKYFEGLRNSSSDPRSPRLPITQRDEWQPACLSSPVSPQTRQTKHPSLAPPHPRPTPRNCPSSSLTSQ